MTANDLSPARRRLITVVVMAATLIVILDTTIANVALPHMQASLGANPETIAWVLTSYILATAIAMPTTGWLSARVGRRTLFVVAILGFTAASALCGVASSLTAMVGFRFAQGLFGAFLAPMSQAVMYDINPPERHAQAMTIWGMVVMVGPILGPVLGGWLTDNFNWRWVFFINVPIGLVAAVGAWALLDDAGRERRPFDYVGFVLLALSLTSLQLMLDRGSQLDWFEATEIWVEAGVAVACLWMFAVHTATAPDGLLPRALFADRNFVTAVLAIAVIGGILIAGAALVAPMLQRLFGYPVLGAGLLTAPRGLGTMAGMMIAGRLANRVDARVTIFVGMVLMAVSLGMMTRFDLAMDSGPVVWSGAIQGLGLGLTVLPMNLLALATLSARLRTEAASLYNLMRSLGGSIAISVTTALIATNVQVSHAELGANVSTTRTPALDAGLLETIGVSGAAAMRVIDAEVNRQALMIAYLDDYWAMMWAAIAVVPLVLLMRGPRGPRGQKGRIVPDAH